MLEGGDDEVLVLDAAKLGLANKGVSCNSALPFVNREM